MSGLGGGDQPSGPGGKRDFPPPQPQGHPLAAWGQRGPSPATAPSPRLPGCQMGRGRRGTGAGAEEADGPGIEGAAGELYLQVRAPGTGRAGAEGANARLHRQAPP